jgi:hypothetical protein
MKTDCVSTKYLPVKGGKLKVWEDQYCANFKGKIGICPAKITWDCNSWSVEGGEVIVGDFGMNYNENGSFDSFVVSGGFGESWSIAGNDIAKIEAGASVKEFIKIGVDKATGNWEVKDFGVKGSVSLEGKGFVGPTHEINILEVSVAVNAGYEAGGIVAPILNLGQ